MLRRDYLLMVGFGRRYFDCRTTRQLSPRTGNRLKDREVKLESELREKNNNESAEYSSCALTPQLVTDI
jgi:hypothetical protein